MGRNVAEVEPARRAFMTAARMAESRGDREPGFDEGRCRTNIHAMTWRSVASAGLAALCLVTAACAEPGESSFRPACEKGLGDGFAALGRAEARGLKGSANWTRAASLLGAARVQKEFGEYQNCALKVRSAETYLGTLATE